MPDEYDKIAKELNPHLRALCVFLDERKLTPAQQICLSLLHASMILKTDMVPEPQRSQRQEHGRELAEWIVKMGSPETQGLIGRLGYLVAKKVAEYETLSEAEGVRDAG